MYVIINLLHALPEAAGIGALLSVFIDQETTIWGFRGNKLLGVSVFIALFLILSSTSIYENYQYRQKMNYVERNIAFLIAGNPLTIEQIEDYFLNPSRKDIEEALGDMEYEGSVRSSKQDAIIMGRSNTSIKAQIFTLSNL